MLLKILNELVEKWTATPLPTTENTTENTFVTNTNNNDINIKHTWQWKEGRLLAYELILSNLLNNHIKCMELLSNRMQNVDTISQKSEQLPTICANSIDQPNNNQEQILPSSNIILPTIPLTPDFHLKNNTTTIITENNINNKDSDETDIDPGTPWTPYPTPINVNIHTSLSISSVPPSLNKQLNNNIANTPPLLLNNNNLLLFNSGSQLDDILYNNNSNKNINLIVIFNKILSQLMSCYDDKQFELKRMAEQVLPLITKIIIWSNSIPSPNNNNNILLPYISLWKILPQMIRQKNLLICRLIAETLKATMKYSYAIELGLTNIKDNANNISNNNNNNNTDINFIKNLRNLSKKRAICAVCNIHNSINNYAISGLQSLAESSLSSDRFRLLTVEILTMLNGSFSLLSKNEWLPVTITNKNRRTQINFILGQINKLYKLSVKKIRAAIVLERTLSSCMCLLLPNFVKNLISIEHIIILPHLLRWLKSNVEVDQRLSLLYAIKIILIKVPLSGIILRSAFTNNNVTNENNNNGNDDDDDDEVQQSLDFSKSSPSPSPSHDNNNNDEKILAEKNNNISLDIKRKCLLNAVDELTLLFQSPALETLVLRQLLDTLLVTCSTTYKSTINNGIVCGIRRKILNSIVKKMCEHCPLPTPKSSPIVQHNANIKRIYNNTIITEFVQPPLSPLTPRRLASSPIRGIHEKSLLQTMRKLQLSSNDIPSSVTDSNNDDKNNINNNDNMQSPTGTNSDGSDDGGSDWDDWDDDEDEGGVAGTDGVVQEVSIFLRKILENSIIANNNENTKQQKNISATTTSATFNNLKSIGANINRKNNISLQSPPRLIGRSEQHSPNTSPYPQQNNKNFNNTKNNKIEANKTTVANLLLTAPWLNGLKHSDLIVLQWVLHKSEENHDFAR